MIKKYEIYYDDGAFYGEIIFENKTDEFIKEYLSEEIKSNNKNINKNYHIGLNNIKKMEGQND